MKLGVRSKLFAVSLVLIVVSTTVAGIILVRDLRAQLELRIETELERTARAALLSLTRAQVRDASLDKLADDLGAATGIRITIIDSVGTVQADSNVATTELQAMENHGQRPEVLIAATKGVGAARRYSRTLETEMLYVAVASDGWTIRAARPLREVDESVSLLRRRLGIAALLGLLIAVVLSGLASHWMTRMIRELATKARKIASVGEDDRSPRGPPADELSHLAGSLNRLSEQIETTVSQVADERGKLTMVLESMEEGVIALDENGLVTLINPMALELLDLTSVPLGQPLSEAIRAPALIELSEESASEPPRGVEVELGNGKHLVARASSGGDGRVIVLHDITEIHRLETVRRDFVANVSHELRTPVSIISANAETLGDIEGLTPGAAKLLNAIHRNAVRMGRLVADLLDLSKLEAGRYEIEAEPIDISPFVASVVAAVTPSAEDTKTRLELDIAPDIVALADRAALDQVLVNLLENAIKYTPENGEVLLRAMIREDKVRFEIEDNGPGIAPAYRDRIFERFYRLDPGRSRATGGTGLGLSIVRHLTTAMGGSVGVTGGEPGGSLFWVELPHSRTRPKSPTAS